MKNLRVLLILFVLLLSSVNLKAVGLKSEFEEFQSILTSGAQDWEYFSIGSNHYLAVAHAYDGSINNIDSKIYKWDGIKFTEFQSIPTNGAIHWTHFVIGSDHYLGLANAQNGVTYNLASKIYKYSIYGFSEVLT